MAIDVVIDTNVLIHADNPDCPVQQDCINLINRLMTTNEHVCIDEGPNGRIYYEYEKHLKIGMLGYTLLLILLNPIENDVIRLKFLKMSINPHINKRINQSGIKKADRKFVRTAYVSSDKILVTEDYEDFTDQRRKYFKKEIGVNVVQARGFNDNF